MTSEGPNIAPYLDLALQIIHACGGETKRADEAAHILACNDPAPDLLAALEAIEPFIPKSTVADGGPNARSAHVVAADMVRAALSQARPKAEGGADV
jgi:hypothetical protein